MFKKKKISSILMLGYPTSLIQRDYKLTTSVIDTEELRVELNEILKKG